MLVRTGAAPLPPHLQPLIAGLSSPCSAMYCLCPISHSWNACKSARPKGNWRRASRHPSSAILRTRGGLGRAFDWFPAAFFFGWGRWMWMPWSTPLSIQGTIAFRARGRGNWACAKARAAWTATGQISALRFPREWLAVLRVLHDQLSGIRDRATTIPL